VAWPVTGEGAAPASQVTFARRAISSAATRSSVIPVALIPAASTSWTAETIACTASRPHGSTG
jgi:hypothetical protein